MRPTTIGLVALAGVLLVPGAHAQPLKHDAEAMRGATSAAQIGLASFAQIVTTENFRAMGFASPGEVRSAGLGVPRPEFLVRLDDLRKFQRGTDASTLLHASGRVTFPVRVADATRSSVVVERAGSSWQGRSRPELRRWRDISTACANAWPSRRDGIPRSTSRSGCRPSSARAREGSRCK